MEYLYEDTTSIELTKYSTLNFHNDNKTIYESSKCNPQ
jgi:hypothetical protein